MSTDHTVDIKGNVYLKYEGALNNAHLQGLTSVDSEMISCSETFAMFKATVETEKGVFSAHGMPPRPTSVSRNSFVRIAETRAFARAFGLATNKGTEDPDDELEQADPPPPPQQVQQPVQTQVDTSSKPEPEPEKPAGAGSGFSSPT